MCSIRCIADDWIVNLIFSHIRSQNSLSATQAPLLPRGHLAPAQPREKVITKLPLDEDQLEKLFIKRKESTAIFHELRYTVSTVSTNVGVKSVLKNRLYEEE